MYSQSQKAGYNEDQCKIGIAESERYAGRVESAMAILDDIFGPAEADRAQPASTSLQNLALKGQVLPLPTGLYKGRQQPGELVRLLAAAEVRGLVGPYVNLQLVHAGQKQKKLI